MSAPTKAEELEEFINTINIPLWEVIQVAMANLIEQSDSEEEATRMETAAEVDAMQDLVFTLFYPRIKCTSQEWRKLAAFCVHYARSRTAAAIAQR